MDRLETIALSSHLSISPYKKYVDDNNLQTTCEDMTDQFHSTGRYLNETDTFSDLYLTLRKTCDAQSPFWPRGQMARFK